MLLNPHRFGSAPSVPVLRLLVANGSTIDTYSYKDPFGAFSLIETFNEPGSGWCAAWSPDGQYAVVGRTAAPYASLYKRSGDLLIKQHDLAGISSTVISCAWNSTSTAVYVGSGTVIRRYTLAGDVLTFDSSPSSALAGALGFSTGISLSPDDAYLACAHATTPFITVYRTSDWAKLASPGTLPAAQGNGCAWHPSGAYLAVAHNTSPRVTLYSFASEVLTKLSNPATLPAADRYGVTWGGSGSYLVLVGATSPHWNLYTFSGGTLTNVSTASFALAGDGYSVAALGDKIVCGHGSGNRITLFTFNGTTIATSAPPVTLPSFSGNGLSIIETFG